MNNTPVKTWSTPQHEEEKIPVPCTLCGCETFIPHFELYVHCAGCGLVQINPQPVPGAVALRYDLNHGNDYLNYELANEKTFLRLQELALSDAGFYKLEQKLLPANPEILDIGCATGALLSALKDRGWNVRGVEVSGPQAAYCRKQRLNVSGISLEENRFQDQFFDVVLASNVIEHLNNPSGFAHEVKRILKPGGYFFITTPNIDGLQARIFGSRWRSAIFDHLYLFSRRNLCTLLEKAGFTVEQIKTWGGLADGITFPFLKRIADKLAKPLGFGDVMIARAICR